MAHATLVKKAQKNIYQQGKYVKYVSESGKRKGQTLTKLDKTIPADKSDKILIAKGESYWWWAFKNGGKHFSKERPKPSQLTQSNYLSQLYSIQESLEEIKADTPEDLESVIEDLKSDLENLKSETEDSLGNMPDSLQSSPTGELLQERIDALDNAISELDGIDFDYDEPDNDTLKDELEEGATDEEIEELKNEKLREWIEEKLQEIQSVSFE
jgi:hypothetical protein